jgi:hypothetical protein
MFGACYPALRRLPGRDSHPLEKRSEKDGPSLLAEAEPVFRHDAPCSGLYELTGIIAPTHHRTRTRPPRIGCPSSRLADWTRRAISSWFVARPMRHNLRESHQGHRNPAHVVSAEKIALRSDAEFDRGLPWRASFEAVDSLLSLSRRGLCTMRALAAHSELALEACGHTLSRYVERSVVSRAFLSAVDWAAKDSVPASTPWKR